MSKANEEPQVNIDELIKQARDRASYMNRLSAVEGLGRVKCQQAIDVLWRLMMNDKVYAVQEAAFRKLQAFGEDVKLPRKAKGNLIKGINQMLGRVASSLDQGFSLDEFKIKFRTMYPEEYDIYIYEKGQNFDKWIANVVGNLPKKRK